MGILGASVVGWITKNLFQVIGSTVIVSVLVGSCMVRDAKLEKAAVQEFSGQVKEATENANQIGKRAADRSRDNRVRGQRDPSTRDD